MSVKLTYISAPMRFRIDSLHYVANLKERAPRRRDCFGQPRRRGVLGTSMVLILLWRGWLDRQSRQLLNQQQHGVD